MELNRKSILDLHVTIGGLLISQGAGENDFVSVTSPQRFGSKTGVQGSVVFYDMPNAIYEVTVSLLETSEANQDMQALFNSQLASSSNGPWNTQIEDTGTGEELSGKSMITKEPDRTKTAEAQNYEWTLHLALPDAAQYNSRTESV